MAVSGRGAVQGRREGYCDDIRSSEIWQRTAAAVAAEGSTKKGERAAKIERTIWEGTF
jgi:hypothetical protein